LVEAVTKSVTARLTSGHLAWVTLGAGLIRAVTI
jgi:hypothetical protein